MLDYWDIDKIQKFTLMPQEKWNLLCLVSWNFASFQPIFIQVKAVLVNSRGTQFSRLQTVHNFLLCAEHNYGLSTTSQRGTLQCACRRTNKTPNTLSLCLIYFQSKEKLSNLSHQCLFPQNLPKGLTTLVTLLASKLSSSSHVYYREHTSSACSKKHLRGILLPSDVSQHSTGSRTSLKLDSYLFIYEWWGKRKLTM